MLTNPPASQAHHAHHAHHHYKKLTFFPKVRMESAGNTYIDKWRLKMMCFDEIIGIEEGEERNDWNVKVDKNGRFYHVTQRAANREFIFDKELGQYRHNLLCRICSRLNVKIIFSVTMSNHTHDVLVQEMEEHLPGYETCEYIHKSQIEKEISKQVQKWQKSLRIPSSL